MQCHHYIELNPLRAAMAADPRDYRWSSHHALAFGDADPLLVPHPPYLALSSRPATRRQAYRRMVMDAVDPADVDAIRRHLQREHAYGSDRFRTAIEAQLGCSVRPQKIGRPRKTTQPTGKPVRAAEPESLSLPGVGKVDSDPCF